MSRCKQLFRGHAIAIVLALFATVIVVAPQIYFRIDHRADGIYQGIELLPDSPWSARVREVMDGHPNLGSIYLKEGKDDPYLFQPLGSQTVAYLGEVFSLDINNTLLLSRLVLTFVVFLLIYGFVFLLSKNKLAALCSAAVLLLANSALSVSAILQLLHGVSPEDFLQIARPVNPVMIYLLLFGFFSSFWLFYQKRDWRWGALSAVLLGLNFYNYFYSWSFLCAFGGLLVLLLLIRKQWREALRVGSVFVGALVVAIPYAFNLYHATQNPAYAEASVRFGIIASHTPLFVGFTVIGALAVFLLWFPRGDREKYFFGLALLLTPFITLNQQLLTGKVLQASHYHWFFDKPLAVIFVLIVLFHLFRCPILLFYKKALAVLIIAVSVGIGVFIQADSYLHGTNDGGAVAIERQQYGPVMQWLNTHANKEDVVLSNNEISHMTVIYTPLNVYYHRADMYSLSATKARLLDILFTFYRLRGVGVKDVHDVFFAERETVSAGIYGMHYRELTGSYSNIPDKEIEDIVALYQESLATSTPQWLQEKLAQYEVNYVVWDKKADPTWNLDKYSFLHQEATLGDIAIYRYENTH